MKLLKNKYVALVVSLVLCLPVYGQMSANLRTAILIKVLNYDRSLETRVNDTLGIGILYFSSDASTAEYAHNIYSGIDKIKHKITVRNNHLRPELLDLAYMSPLTTETFVCKLKDKDIHVLLILVDDETLLDVVVETTRTLKINSICIKKDYLKHGIAFAITEKGNTLQLCVNINAAKKEGSDYSGKLLRICKKVY